MAKISIIVPAYNRERYIAKCLDSLLAQTYKDYEIIIVDNNSEDRTAVIADEYAKQNPKVTVIQCKKQGVSCARNAGIKAATGDFISFIDSDDYVDPEMFADLHAKIIEQKADIAICGFQKETETGEKLPGENPISNYSGNDAIKRYLCLPSAPVAKLIRRSIIEDNKISFNEELSLGEDLAFVSELICYTDKLCFVNKDYYHYVIQDKSLMSSKNPEREKQIFTALDQVYKNFAKQPELLEKYSAEIEHIFIANLVLSASTRYMIPAKDKEFYLHARTLMAERFPNWWHNKYYAQRGKSMKIFFNLYRRGRILAYSRLIARLKS